MNKIIKTIFLTLSIASLTACSGIFEVEPGGSDPVDKTGNGNKTHLNYTYDDYTKYNTYELDSCPNSGNPKLLVIPVWFTDSANYISNATLKEQVRDDIETCYFGTAKETGWQSVSSYYSALSMNKCNVTGVVSNWYAPGKSVSTYATSSDKTCDLVTDAVDWYFQDKTSEERKSFDTNGDGYLDGVMLIYAAPDYVTLKKSTYSNLWAYCYWQQDSTMKSTSTPGANVFFWASYDFMYGEAKALTRAGSRYAAGNTTYCELDTHTYIHEMGHVFGLDDYYDYSNQYNPAGGFSMQDYNVGSHDPYSAMALGWADPYVSTETKTYNIGNFQDSHDLILLSTSTNVKSPFDEYILLELYTPTGLNDFDSKHLYAKNYPQGPKVAGVRIWHVDARLTTWTGRGYSETAVTTPDASHRNVTHMMTNTYSSSEVESGYLSPLGSSYANYNLLQLIRKDVNVTYRPTDILSADSLFRTGDSFSISMFSKQFVKGSSGQLNNGTTFDWTVSFDEITSDKATITVTKIA